MFNYCTVEDVKGELLGLDVSDLPSTLLDRIEEDYIPTAKREVDSYCAENFDLTNVKEFYNGNNMPTLALRHKPIRQINNVVMRIVPSLKWFQFRRWFVVKNTSHDGTVVALAGGVAPATSVDVPPYTYLAATGLEPTSLTPTGTFEDSTERYEQSDLHVDAANGILIIPPRVLFVESQGIPFWNYTWIMGNRNVEVDYKYGYKDIDSLPFELRKAAAKLVAAKVLQVKAMWVSAGTKSISMDGVSKSFGEGAYSTEIKALKEEAYAVLNRYKRITV